MSTLELLTLFQTIIALLALLVSVAHIVYEMSKDRSRGKKHKKK